MKHSLIRLLLPVLVGIALFSPSLTSAQGLSSLLSGTSTEDTSSDQITDIMESAAQNGVNVIVIDSDGRVITQAGTPSTVNEAPGTGSTLMAIQDDAVAFRTALVDRLLNLPVAFNEVVYILRATSPDGTIFAYVQALLTSLALFAVGMVFEAQVFGKRIAKRFVVARIHDAPDGYVEKMPFLVFRFLMGIAGTLVSMAVAYLLGAIIFGPLEDAAMQFTVTLINIGYFLARIVAGLWRMILSPYLPQYRIPLFSDGDARKLHLWLSAVAAFGFFAILFGVWIEELGLNSEVHVFLFSLLSLLVMCLNIMLVIANGRAITGAILNGKTPSDSTWVLRTLARVWGPLAVLYFLFAWGEQTYHLVIGDPAWRAPTGGGMGHPDHNHRGLWRN